MQPYITPAGPEVITATLAVTEPIQASDVVTPVSYTHLDVYKRQLFISVLLATPAVAQAQATLPAGSQGVVAQVSFADPADLQLSLIHI